MNEETKDLEVKTIAALLGRRGGLKTLANKGAEHYKICQAKSVKARKRNKQLLVGKST